MEEMVGDPNCAYCMQGELVAKSGYPVCEMNTRILYAFKEQSKKGRVILARKKHVSEFIDLTDREQDDYFTEIARVSGAVHKAFNPNKVNYGTYGDTGHYPYLHIVPKYQGGEERGDAFEMNSRKTALSDGEYKEMVGALRKALKEVQNTLQKVPL